MVDKREKSTYTKDMLIKEVAVGSKIDKRTVKHVYDYIEKILFEHLSSANSEKDIAVRMFEGISFNGVYVPEHEKVNNLTGETIKTKGKIVPKAHITRTYCDKINRAV